MFCLEYYPHTSKYIKGVDEFKIIYNPADRSLEDFLDFYKDISIIIDVSNNFDEVDAKLLKGLYDKYHNFKIIFSYLMEEYIDRVKKYKLPFFFSNSITTIDQMTGLLEYQPTDMYICEELGFHLDKISKILHEHNIKVRVYPNICQSSFSKTPSIKTFFIRPEDISIYANYVDVFELITDEQRQEIIYKIYKQEKWFGEIKEIIPSFKSDLSSRYLLKEFGAIRLRCGKRCVYKPGCCNICDRMIDVADTLKESKLVIRKLTKKKG